MNACANFATLATLALAAAVSFPPREAIAIGEPSPTITVTSLDDPGDGRIDDGVVTLREAIDQANAAPDRDTIIFGDVGPGPVVVRLASPLPPITDPLVIDGFERPGYPTEPEVEIDGSAASGEICDGLDIAADQTEVRGLAIVNFSGYGVVLRGRGAAVFGCRIGVSLDGSTPAGNGLGGVYVQSSGNQIGAASDLTPLLRNVIADNGSHGVEIAGGSNNVVAANVVSDNAGCGVIVTNGMNNMIGGLRKGEGNTIASNGDVGVRVLSGTGNTIALNGMSSNAGLAIDLGPAGPTPNDPGDADTGANLLQNSPVLNSARNVVIGAVVHGAIGSAPNTTYRLEFFDTGAFVRTLEVTTNASGAARFRVLLLEVRPGRLVTATATDPAGNTSEVSLPVRVATAR